MFLFYVFVDYFKAKKMCILYLDIKKILAIVGTNSDLVNHMLISRSRMHPGTFMFVFVLKQRIAYDQIKLVAQAQEMQLHFSIPCLPSPPCDVVISNTSIKVTKNNKFVITEYSSHSFSELKIEVSDILLEEFKVGS